MAGGRCAYIPVDAASCLVYVGEDKIEVCKDQFATLSNPRCTSVKGAQLVSFKKQSAELLSLSAFQVS